MSNGIIAASSCLMFLAACTASSETEYDDPAPLSAPDALTASVPDEPSDRRREDATADTASAHHGGGRDRRIRAVWSPPSTLAQGDVTGFALASDGTGAHLTFGRDCAIYTRLFRRDTWGQPRALRQDAARCASAPRSALDQPDRAVTAWVEYPMDAPSRAPLSVWALRHRLHGSDGALPVQLSTSPMSPPVQRVAGVHVDRTRRAAVLWTSQSGDVFSLSAAVSASESAFLAPSLLVGVGRGYTVRGDVFAHDVTKGSTLFFWAGSFYSHPYFSEDTLYARRLDATGTWSDAPLDPAVVSPHISGAALGAGPHDTNALAVWGQTDADAGVASIAARTYRDGAWDPIHETVTEVSTTGAVAVAVRDGGDALALFVSEAGLQTAQRTAGRWSTAASALVAKEEGSTLSHPQVTLDGAGNAAAVWLRRVASEPASGKAELWASFRPAGAMHWHRPQRLGRADLALVAGVPLPPADTSSAPRLTSLGVGRALAVWTHWRGPGQTDLLAAHLR